MRMKKMTPSSPMTPVMMPPMTCCASVAVPGMIPDVSMLERMLANNPPALRVVACAKTAVGASAKAATSQRERVGNGGRIRLGRDSRLDDLQQQVSDHAGDQDGGQPDGGVLDVAA